MFEVKTIKNSGIEETYNFINEEMSYLFAEKEIASRENRKVIISSKYYNSILLIFFR